MQIFKASDVIVSANLTLDAHVIDNLGLDSLDVVHIVIAMEDEFNIEIPDEEAMPLQTVGHFLNFVR